MASRVFTGFIVAFWVVMMAALVRVEYFPSPTNLTPVPTSQVIRRVFGNYETQRLNVSYQGKPIGMCHFDITPLAALDATPSQPIKSSPGAYAVQAGLTVNLTVFGTPSLFQLTSDSHFDRRYDLKKYALNTTVAGTHVEIRGDNETKKLSMKLDLGDGPQQKQLDYAQLAGPGALEALGLHGLSGLAGLALPTTLTGASGAADGASPLIHTYEDRVTIGGMKQHAYLIEFKSRQNEAFWAKAWIDDQGGLLIVETSVGLTLRSESIDTLASRPSMPPIISKTRPLQ